LILIKIIIFLDNANILFNKLIKENENDKYHDYLKIRNIGGIIVTYNDNNDIKFCTFKKEDEAVKFIEEKIKNDIYCGYISDEHQIHLLCDSFTTANNEITVCVKINNNNDDNLFIFDTGAQITTINQKIIDDYKLIPLGKSKLTGINGKIDCNYYNISIKISDKDDEYKIIRCAGPCINLFGYNIISKYIIIINGGVIKECKKH